MQISAAATCGLLLVASNIFMTSAWYGAPQEPRREAVVPANRIGAILYMDQPVNLAAVYFIFRE